jgi:hypothetical protein
MSATCGGCEHERETGGRIGGRVASLLSIAITIAFSLVLPAGAADEKQGHKAAQVASLGGSSNSSPSQAAIARKVESELDLKVLLAQNGPPTITDAANSEDAILVALAISVPQQVEEDIAKQYGLELIERTELPQLGLRIVRMRVSGNRSIEPILAELRTDQRIRRAQRNVQYGPPIQGAPATAAAAAAPAPVQPRPGRKRTAAAHVAHKLPEPAREAKRAPAHAEQPLRVGKIGDVLSGGL